jgi:hypothetical protein
MVMGAWVWSTIHASHQNWGGGREGGREGGMGLDVKRMGFHQT